MALTWKLFVAAILMTSSASFAEGVRGNDLQWEANKVNETITAEARLDFLVKNYDDNGDMHGSLKIGLFGERVPMTVLNFVSLCNGVKRPQGELKYTGSSCHKLITDMHVQCGDITNGDGSGGTSIFGETFNDESFDVGLSEAGTIAMANRGADSNGSQFFIIFRSMQSLDKRHVAFGQIVDKASLEFLFKLNEVPTDGTTFIPKRKIKLVDCSATNLKKPLMIRRRVAAHLDRF
uniref:Peptidyl-prolyl cis-trans isomerase n=1 Tax=Reishia bronni TaxID=578817 RepID=A0A6G9KPB8_9CAEN|nr:capsule gland specific secretory protein [Reishia bronni]